ncbi:MAG: GTP-binding protein [Calditrichaeota bacterium]|nr:MAG: GTP-binding protein [Calditrichota bacterium]MBL1206019.1 GTP-binding protein [Calditrichota bacterium]NOG45847.1 GTP-binding protein [Calditrichota bacterium]
MSLIKKKICLLGDIGVGKTSLIRRFVEDLFDDSYLTTIGVKVSQKKVVLENSKELFLMIWDVEGAANTNEINTNYLTGASGAIIVSDLTRLQTVEINKNFIDIFLKINPGAHVVLAGNKVDLITKKHPGYNFFTENSKILESPFFFTSAKDGENVEACFQNISQKLITD